MRDGSPLKRMTFLMPNKKRTQLEFQDKGQDQEKDSLGPQASASPLPMRLPDSGSASWPSMSSIGTQANAAAPTRPMPQPKSQGGLKPWDSSGAEYQSDWNKNHPQEHNPVDNFTNRGVPRGPQNPFPNPGPSTVDSGGTPQGSPQGTPRTPNPQQPIPAPPSLPGFNSPMFGAMGVLTTPSFPTMPTHMGRQGNDGGLF